MAVFLLPSHGSLSACFKIKVYKNFSEHTSTMLFSAKTILTSSKECNDILLKSRALVNHNSITTYREGCYTIQAK